MDHQKADAPRVEITIQNLAASVAAIAGLLALFLVLAPRAALSLGAVQLPVILLLAAILSLCALVLLHRLFANRNSKLRERLLPTRTSIIVWILLVGGALVYLLSIWQPPTEQQVARQILNNRGLLLTRAHYMTTVEIGDWNSLRLFHEAGYNRSTAFDWLGRRAQTHPELLSIDLLLSQIDNQSFKNTVSVIANGQAQTSSSSVESALINKAISIDEEYDLGNHELWETASPALAELATTRGITMLGHAILARNRKAVMALLSLGADWALATMPLLEIAELAKYSPLLAVDPFLYVLNDENRDESGELTLLERDSTHPLADILMEQGYRPSQLARAYAASDLPRTCAAGELAAQRGFVGYRRTTDGYEVGDFVFSSCTVSRHTIQAEGTMAFIDIDHEDASLHESSLHAVLRIASRADDGPMASASETYSWLGGSSEPSPSADGPWEHYSGRFLRDSKSLLLDDQRGQIRFAAVSGSMTARLLADRVRASKRSAFGSLSCESDKSVRLLEAEHVLLQCDRTGEVTISRRDSGRPYLLVMEEDGIPKYSLIVDSTSPIRLPSGSHSLAGVDLSDAGKIVLEVRYRVAEPRLTVVEESESLTDWPTSEFTMVDELREDDQRIVLLEVDYPINGTIRLTGLSADLDLSVECMDEGDLCPWSSHDSINSGTTDESIDAILAPGTYRVRVYSYDEASSFRLVLGAEDTTRLLFLDGVAEHFEEEPSEDDLLSFEIEHAGRVDLTLEPVLHDMDIQLVDSLGTVLGESQEFDDDRDTVSIELEKGTYYVRIWAVETPGRYRVRVLITGE